MNLTIKKQGGHKESIFKLMDGDRLFCTTKIWSDAILIRRAFSNIDEDQKQIKQTTMTEILQKIKELKKIDLSKDFTRYTEVLFLRYIYCRIARDNGYSLEAIGFEINRDHSTIIHSLRKFEDYFETNRNFRDLYFEILKSIL